MVSAHRNADDGGAPEPFSDHHVFSSHQLMVTDGGDEIGIEDGSKKLRKPYTITKTRESWTEQEHDKFLEALKRFDRDWKKIEAFVGSKSVIQIRSHAQKYFLKVEKNGTSEHVPPPRPKRKAAHPYPQKASKNALQVSQPTALFQSSTFRLEPGYTPKTGPSAALRKSGSEDIEPDGTVTNNCCSSSSTEGHSRTWHTGETTDKGNIVPSLRGLPDFAQVYNFIGSVFDPGTSGHMDKLKEMDPIDSETVVLLMRNLSLNLTSLDFEDHRKLLSESVSENVKPGSAERALETDKIGERCVIVPLV